LGGRAFGQSPPQLTDFFETLCHVTYDRDNRDDYARTVPQRENREFNRYCRSVLVQRRYGEDVALAVAAVSRCYRATISPPMPFSQTLRNDYVEGVTDGVSGGMTENALRAGIPKTNNAVAVGGDNGVRARVQQRFCN